MIILSIETSCDETSVAIIKARKGKNYPFLVLSHKVFSQIEIHKEFGGVFPNLAKREHSKALPQMILNSLIETKLISKNKKEIEIKKQDLSILKEIFKYDEDGMKRIIEILKKYKTPKIDYISVTSGPGLAPALWVGVSMVNAISLIWKIKKIDINHLEGHILISAVKETKENNYEIHIPKKNTLALLISGGHTEIVKINKNRKYIILGRTEDDAIGEAFDKTARMLKLKYPGGPEISKLANSARNSNLKINKNDELPRPMIYSNDLDFSFSGLKTAVLTKIKKIDKEITEKEKKIISLDFENSVTEVLLKKIKDAMFETKSNNLIIGGGVIANIHIKNSFKDFCEKEKYNLFLPKIGHSGDNALMIAIVTYYAIKNGIEINKNIIADGNFRLDQIKV